MEFLKRNYLIFLLNPTQHDKLDTFLPDFLLKSGLNLTRMRVDSRCSIDLEGTKVTRTINKNMIWF